LNGNPDIKKDLTGQKPSESEKPFFDQVKTEMLAAGIAHDLNNILATISGYAELLRDDLPKDSALTENVSRILNAVAKARSLTDKMLELGKPSGRIKTPVIVNEILKEAIDFTRPALPPGIMISSDIRKRKVIILTDPTQLFRIFLNLIINAAQSMEKSGGNVNIGLRILNADRVKPLINRDIIAEKYCVVTFRDTGSGINPSLLQKIFEPYVTTGRAGKGTGLGLSVVSEIVAGMEGEIIVSSKENEGSVFDVYLPVFKKTTA
jgi:signal transduction histidine kinase